MPVARASLSVIARAPPPRDAAFGRRARRAHAEVVRMERAKRADLALGMRSAADALRADLKQLEAIAKELVRPEPSVTTVSFDDGFFVAADIDDDLSEDDSEF